MWFLNSESLIVEGFSKHKQKKQTNNFFAQFHLKRLDRQQQQLTLLFQVLEVRYMN